MLHEELDYLKQTYINNFLKEYSERFIKKHSSFLRKDKQIDTKKYQSSG